SREQAFRVGWEPKNKNPGKGLEGGNTISRCLDLSKKLAKIRYVQSKSRSKQDNRLTQTQEN
ncbi:30026_t:CDS:1, partial [Gigaspora margarita]